MIDSFFGIKDHSGYRFTNLMPRWMAERYCKIRKPAKYLTEEEMSGYRTYTYSYWSWKNFLKNSGFSNISVYGLLPTYNNIEIQSRLDRSSIYRFCINTFVGERSIKRRILGALGRFGCYFGLQKLLHPFFGILARKPAANSAPQYDTRPDLVRSKPLSNKIISFYFDNSDVPTRVKKSVRYPNQAHLLKQEITGLEKANKIVGNNFDFTIPKILELKNSNQSLSFEQSAIAGNPLSKALDKARPHEDILYRFGPITEGFSILEKMASIQLHDEEHAHSQANVIAESFSRVVTPDNDLTSKFHQLLVNEINKTDWKKIACVPQHGDFSPSNILIDDKSISAIIDWEHFSETGLPLMDSLFFALTCTGFTRSINIGNNPTVEMVGNRYSHSFNLCFLKNSNLRRAISRHVKTICNITGMDLQSTRVLLPLFLADIATRFSIEEKNIIDPRYTGCIKLFMNADQASFFKDD
jgi:thiamine kinase-like enzyme